MPSPSLREYYFNICAFTSFKIGFPFPTKSCAILGSGERILLPIGRPLPFPCRRPKYNPFGASRVAKCWIGLGWADQTQNEWPPLSQFILFHPFSQFFFHSGRKEGRKTARSIPFSSSSSSSSPKALIHPSPNPTHLFLLWVGIDSRWLWWVEGTFHSTFFPSFLPWGPFS